MSLPISAEQFPQSDIQIVPVGAGLDRGIGAAGAFVIANVAVERAYAGQGLGAAQAFIVRMRAGDDGAIVVTVAQGPHTDKARVQAYGCDDAKI